MMLGIARKSLLAFICLAAVSHAYAIDRHAARYRAEASELLRFLESILDGHPPAPTWSKLRRGADLCWRTRECGLLDQALFPYPLPLSEPSGLQPDAPHFNSSQEQI